MRLVNLCVPIDFWRHLFFLLHFQYLNSWNTARLRSGCPFCPRVWLDAVMLLLYFRSSDPANNQGSINYLYINLYSFLQVLQGLESATNCVDDMDEWLGIFNLKLRHMREDIESVKISAESNLIWKNVLCT